MRNHRGSRPIILIVDDEPAIRKVLRDMAQKNLKAETMEAKNGHEALSLFVQRTPDLVVTDIRMPGTDGLLLLKQLKEEDPIVPVILMTGYPSIAVAIQGMKEGATDFLTKPFRLEEVQVVLEKALREKRLLQENKDLREEISRKRAIEQLNEKLHRRITELSALHSLGETIGEFPLNWDVILSTLVNVAREVTHARRTAFFANHDRGTDLRMVLQDGVDSDPHERDGVGAEERRILGQAKKLKRPILGEARWAPSDPSLNYSTGGHLGSSQVAIPLLIKGEVFGVLHAIGKIQGSDFDQQDLFILSELAKRASLGLENRFLYESVFDVLMSTLRSLVFTIEAKDPYTKEHSQRVTDFAVLMAQELGYAPEQIDSIRVAGSLHDLGKLGVRDSILLKPGRFTDEEFEEIKAHPVIGESILAPIGFLSEERVLIRHHHERWDGGGYPDGLKGEEIPLLTRVITIADAFDAMTSDRHYRPAMSFEQGYHEVVRCKGTHFDPQIVEAFMAVFPHWVKILRAEILTLTEGEPSQRSQDNTGIQPEVDPSDSHYRGDGNEVSVKPHVKGA